MNQTVRVGSTVSDPFRMSCFTQIDCPFRGSEIETLKIFLDMFRFNIEWVLLPTAADEMGMLMNGSLDFLAAAKPMQIIGETKNALKELEISPPVFESTFILAHSYKTGLEVNGFLVFSKVDISVWLALLFTVLSSYGLLVIAENANAQKKFQRFLLGLLTSCLFTLAIVLATYTNFLAIIFSKNINAVVKPYKNMDDLQLKVKQGKCFLILRNRTLKTLELLNRTHNVANVQGRYLLDAVLKHPPYKSVIVTSSNEDVTRFYTASKYSKYRKSDCFAFLDYVEREHLHSEYGYNMIAIDESIKKSLFSISYVYPFRKDAIENIRFDFMDAMYGGSLYDHEVLLRNRYLNSQPRAEISDEVSILTATDVVKPLRMAQLSGLFVVLACGCSIALLFLLAEITAKRMLPSVGVVNSEEHLLNVHLCCVHCGRTLTLEQFYLEDHDEHTKAFVLNALKDHLVQ